MRPEDLSIASGETAPFTGEVTLVEHLGEVTLLYVDLGQGGDEPLVAKLSGSSSVKRGEMVKLEARAEALRLFDEEGKAIRPASMRQAA